MAIIENAKGETLFPLIKEKVTPDSIVYTDTWKGYNALDVSEFHHHRINHSKLFAEKKIISMELRTFGIKQNDI